MKRFILGLCFLVAVLSSNPIAAMDCEEAAKYWGYDLEEAMAFGKQLKRILRQKDLKTLATLIPGELERGPRKRRFEEERWSEVFGNKLEWTSLFSIVPCKPGWWFDDWGFNLSEEIWYTCDRSGCGIHIIDNWIKHPDNKPENSLWELDGKILHPDCFYLNWWSNDNYQELLEGTNCTAKEIGQCLERENGIGLYKDVYGETLAIKLDTHSFKPRRVPTYQFCPRRGYTKAHLQGHEIARDVSPKTGFLSERKGTGWTWYRVVRILPNELCKQLAPHIPYVCRDIRLVELTEKLGDWGHGIRARYGNIYGLFSDTDQGHDIMVPLANFWSLNESLNYVDGLLEKQE